MTDPVRPSPRYFILNGCGFARFHLFREGDGPLNSGELHVRSVREKSWVLAGVQTLAVLDESINRGLMLEFSPASLLSSVSTIAKSQAARLNGAKGGRPRKRPGKPRPPRKA